MDILKNGGFRKIGTNIYIIHHRQLPLAITGGFLFLLISIAFFEFIVESFSDGSILFGIFFILLYLIPAGIGLLMVVIGLFTVITEIDLAKRTIRVTRRTIFGKKATQETSIDNIGISAIRLGVTDANPQEKWIVRAGYFYTNSAGQDCSVVIWSKEIQKETERDQTMCELYEFLFPDRPTPTEEDFITNGDAIMLLSHEQKEAFKKGTLFEVIPDEKEKERNKFDKLLD
ncbi:MAG: hypothetical protein GX639_22045 [Fibrobacter sp.]|nr:hypothetical protein [Fibrobacter sp.]